MSLNLQNLPQVNGDDVLTTGSAIAPSQIDANGSTNGQVLVSDGTGVSWGTAGGGGGGSTLNSPVQLGTSDLGETYISQDTPLNIPDDLSTGITSARYIADSQTIDTLSIDLDISHPDMGEVTVVLTTPSGVSPTVYDGDNAGQANLTANIGWEQDLNTGNLYSFYGEDTVGAWTLNVVDAGASNIGTLNEWTLHINESFDGEMFIGNDLTVQGTARVRDELRVEYGGSLV